MLSAPTAKASFNDGLMMLTRAEGWASIRAAVFDLDASFWLYALARPKDMSGILYCVLSRCLDSQIARISLADQSETGETLKAKLIAELSRLAGQLRKATKTEGEARQSALAETTKQVEQRGSTLPESPLTEAIGGALKEAATILVERFADEQIRVCVGNNESGPPKSSLTRSTQSPKQHKGIPWYV